VPTTIEPEDQTPDERRGEVLSRSWRMYAHQEDGYFENFGERWWVKIHGLDLPVVEVVLTEDPEGTCYGWLATGEETPTMIWPSRAQFEVCFPCGWRAEEDAGRGRMVRMRAEKAPDGGPSSPYPDPRRNLRL